MQNGMKADMLPANCDGLILRRLFSGLILAPRFWGWQEALRR
jgi:hypothetical protein